MVNIDKKLPGIQVRAEKFAYPQDNIWEMLFVCGFFKDEILNSTPVRQR